jgi:hypothetical protein
VSHPPTSKSLPTTTSGSVSSEGRIMRSLFPPIVGLQEQLQPISDALGLRTLPLHAHEIILAFAFYHFIFQYLGPRVSTWLVPKSYEQFSVKTTLKWNIQCVSMVQSILICSLALWVMANDEDRKGMDSIARVWGYSGAAGTVQAFATGYFVWDLLSAIRYVKYLGLPVLIHAMSCLTVYSLGFVSLPIVDMAVALHSP